MYGRACADSDGPDIVLHFLGTSWCSIMYEFYLHILLEICTKHGDDKWFSTMPETCQSITTMLQSHFKKKGHIIHFHSSLCP